MPARLLAAALLFAPLAAAAEDIRLPAGRYRCYQPPSYVVTAWFDIVDGDRYLFQGDAPGRYRFDPASREVHWEDGVLADAHRTGRYHPPSAEAPTGQRHAIVLAPRAQDGGKPSECFLTTH